jgi:hypothetical protein
MNNQIFKCPLCESILDKEKWIKITGQWDERQKLLDNTKKEIEKYKKEKLEAEKKFQIELKKAARIAEATGVTKGIQKEKSERERMNKMLQKQAKDIIESQKKIQELQRQLKEGKTPQIAGFDYEKEVEKILKENFPDDDIKPTGKKGDVIQTVIYNKKIVGSILYECKKTEKYDNSFIKEIKRHQEVARADYGVIVTHALKQNKSSFFIDESIIVIDPMGLLDIAYLLRITLIQLSVMKLTKEKTEQKGQEILRYMQTGEFKKYMIDNVEKSKSAYRLLIKEVDSHKKNWEERLKIYFTIHQNTQSVRLAIGKIITGGTMTKLEDEPFPSFEELNIPLLNKSNK